MAFRVEFSELAAGKFRKLDKAARERIAAKLRRTAEDPAHHLSRLSSVEAYKLRVGDYRVIIDAEWGGKILYVVMLGHRSTSGR
ncbi:MAG: type II toxin-antitoxin system RelE/ParE family toxin [Methanobacteriota archaeon]|nr:MAG: type II toxin-antitoxin system RelE/ParE family toxin [Euryarchaeota archaeon]